MSDPQTLTSLPQNVTIRDGECTNVDGLDVIDTPCPSSAWAYLLTVPQALDNIVELDVKNNQLKALPNIQMPFLQVCPPAFVSLVTVQHTYEWL